MTTFLIFLFPYTLSQFYRTFLAVIAPELASELDLRADDLANMSAAWFFTFALAQLPIGLTLDRIGPRRIVPGLMLAAVAGAVLLANARTAWDCIIANGLIGIGCSPIYMGALYHFARTEPSARFGFLTGAMLGLGSSGNLLAATPLSLAAEAYGWRGAFYGIAALTLLAALVVAACVRDPERIERPAGAGSAMSGFIELLGMRKLWLIMPLTMMGYGAILAERGLWVGPYLSDVHGLDPVSRGNAALAMAIAMSVGALAYGVLDQATDRRKPLVLLASLVTAACFLLLWMWPRPDLLFAVVVLTVMGCVGLAHPLILAHSRAFFPDHLVGRGITLANFVSIGGAGLLQWMSGIYVTALQTRGLPAADVYAALHLGFAVLLLAATAVYALSDPARRRTAAT